MSSAVSISNLQPGMVIVQVLKQNGPVKIRKSGLVTSQEMVEGLKEMGVLEVEIDPDQTVELEQTTPQTQTQFLLQSNSRQASDKQDSQLAEQFNRSLFLPSAQNIPDAWQIYGKQAALTLLIVSLGFGLGFSGAKISQNWNQDNAATLVSSPAQSTSDESTPANVNKEMAPVETETVSEPVESAIADDVASTVQESTEFADSKLQEAPLVLGVQPENIETLGLDSTSPSTFDDIANEDGNDVTSEVPSPSVSPELLRRFEQAMAELESESAVEEPSQEVVETSSDVMRIDQLPAWVLTSMPKLSFKAHMYASDPQERWLIVNDMELAEGDWINDRLKIERIEPQHVIMNYQGHEFSMAALSEW